MKVLVIGSGGREHALCTSLTNSTLITQVIVAPGNAGMAETLSNLLIKNISATDGEKLLKLALDEKVDLTVVGPEASLSEGIVDLFQASGLLIVGPAKAASLLESSKAFAKKVMIKNNVPTAAYAEFFSSKAALDYIENSTAEKMVVKCDGLAAGKGVIVCQNKKEAMAAVRSLMIEMLLGENVAHIIIEEFLDGLEVSAFALCDGSDFIFLGTACDHKRLKDNDEGPNTGGMGVFSPAKNFDDSDRDWVNQNVFAPMMNGMKQAGSPFAGILFAGLMKTAAGWKVLEFNVRLGDPETQVILPLIDEDLVPWLLASAKGELQSLQNKLGRQSPKIKSLNGVHVVMAAHGYPGTEGEAVRSGDEITFQEKINSSDKFLFFAGVEKRNNKIFTKGGRVLGVTALAANFSAARDNAYALIKTIEFKGAQYRSDIARGLK